MLPCPRLQVARLSQLMLQYMQYRVAQAESFHETLENDKMALQGALNQIPNLSLSDVDRDLQDLQVKFYGLASYGMDDMFKKVREEEKGRHGTTAVNSQSPPQVQQQGPAAVLPQQQQQQAAGGWNTGAAPGMPPPSAPAPVTVRYMGPLQQQ